MSKELEAYYHLSKTFACKQCQYWKDKKCSNGDECIWLDIEKELKALEIIKNKDIDLIKLKSSASYEEYEITYILDYPKGNHIPREEYDLLREVLL